MRRAATLLLLLALGAPAAPAEESKPAPPAPPPDLFAQVLREAGLAQDALGYRAKGTWNRYPNAPYKLPFFDDLLAEPTSTYEFVRTLGNVVEDWLTPERLREADPKKATALFRLGVALGTERRIGGFRGPFGDLPVPGEAAPQGDPLLEVLKPLHPGPEPDDMDWAPLHEALAEDVAAIPEVARAPLARFLRRLESANQWIRDGIAKIPVDLRNRVEGMARGLVESDGDGTSWNPALEEAVRLIDEHSLAYGALLALQATQDARRDLAAVAPEAGWPDFRFEWHSRLGLLYFGTGTPSSGSFLAVCFRRADLPTGGPDSPVSIGAADQGLSVGLFLDGLDRYGAPSGFLLITGDGPPPPDFARGVLGCGIVYVAGDGSTRYSVPHRGLGFGLLGIGVLVDEGGDDTYESDSMAQGAGMFGVGLLLDAAGNDKYVLRKGDGQGFGGPNGIGVLADRSGNDSYYAEPDAAKAGRADYHSDHKVAVSNAQGVGSGRRGDLTDGHAWAGGLGALIDVDGDDRYRAGNFSQGCGYWFGTGAIYDGGGNDEYRSVYFTQASGAHFAVGTIVDEGGDDVHVLEENAGAGLGFGWDVVNAILHDRAGNDRYEAKIISVGCANVRSNGWLLDEAGDDVYLLDEAAVGFGGVDDRPAYSTPDRYAPFAFHLPQLGLLVDAGGTDRYLRRPKAGGDPVPDERAKDGAAWGNGAPGPRGGPNVARGLDAPSGRVGFLDPWPRRAP